MGKLLIMIIILNIFNMDCEFKKISILFLQVLAYTISFLWCFSIVGNQLDYVTKPWMEEHKEVRQKSHIIN
jgi:hypothetical protein